MRVNLQRELEQKKDTDEVITAFPLANSSKWYFNVLTSKINTIQQGETIQSPFETFDYINNEQQNDDNHRSSGHSISPKPAPTTKTREVSTISSSPKSCLPKHRKTKSVDGGLKLSRFIF